MQIVFHFWKKNLMKHSVIYCIHDHIGLAIWRLSNVQILFEDIISSWDNMLNSEMLVSGFLIRQLDKCRSHFTFISEITLLHTVHADAVEISIYNVIFALRCLYRKLKYRLMWRSFTICQELILVCLVSISYFKFLCCVSFIYGIYKFNISYQLSVPYIKVNTVYRITF